MSAIVNLCVTIGNYLWGMPLIVLFLGSGIILSIVLRVPQVRHIKEMWHLLFHSEAASDEGVSSFQAFTLAIAGRVGTGNVAGVATAICYGGPGAMFWMWIIAIVGAAITFVEGTVSQIYKETIDGQYRGGTPFYIRKALNLKKLAGFFAIWFAFSMIATQVGLHANTMASAIKGAVGIPTWISGIVIVALLAIVVIGGVKRIASVAEKVVPFMTIAYIAAAILVILVNITRLPSVIALIFTSAFGQDQIIGALLGSAMIWGTKRAVFSSDAGLSTASSAAGAAEVSHPIKQGMVQSFSIYVDTLFVCTATGIMLLMTNSFNVLDSSGAYLANNLGEVAAGAEWVTIAMNSVIPVLGGIFVAIEMFIFGYTTILNLYYGSESMMAQFFIGKKQPKWFNIVLQIACLAFVFAGTIMSSSDLWTISDACLGVLLWINMIVLCILAKQVIALQKDYEEQRKAGLDPVFDPEKFNFPETDVWIGIRDKYLARRNK